MARDETERLAMGARIKELRETHGFKQQFIADHVGVQLRTYQMWQAGQITPEQENLGKLAELFGVTPKYILKGETPEPVTIQGDPDRLSAIEDRLERIERQLELLVGVSSETVGVDLPPADVVYGAPGSGKSAGLVQVIGSVRRDLDELLTYRREAQEQLRGFDVEEARDLLNLIQEVQARQGREVGRRELQSRAATGR